MNGHAVFDLDGTLVDSAPLCAAILNAMLAERGASFQLSTDETRPHVTAGGPAMVAALLGPHCSDPAREIGEFRDRYAATPTPPSSLYPGARQALAELAGLGIGTAVWSNKPQELCDKVLGDLGLVGCFAAIVGTGPHVPLKPDPTGLDLALARAGGARGHACYVGDSELDHEAAALAGLPFILLTHGYGRYDRPWPGAVVADGFAAVPALVAAILARPLTPSPPGRRIA